MSVAELKTTWEHLGRSDPLWAVLSDPARRGGGWDPAEFMATGEDQASVAVELAAKHELALGERALDFGCGVGRISNALAARLARVVGVDIAESMLEQARALNRHPDRLEFVGYDGGPLPFTDGSFDSAVSFMVLQHARPAIQLANLLELLRVVRPGGVLILQVPSHPARPEPLAEDAARASIELVDAPERLPAGGTGVVRARLTNRSPHPWPAERQIKLGNHWLRDGSIVVADDGRATLEHELAPGASCVLDLAVQAPSLPGIYRLEVDVVQEFVAWWRDLGSETAGVEVRVRETDGSSRPPSPSVSEAICPGTMEMHGLPISLMRAICEQCSTEVVEAAPGDCAGPEWVDFTYLLRRVG